MDSLYIKKMAQILTEYCISVEAKQTVLVTATTLATPLVEELYRIILVKAAYPRIKLSLPSIPNLFYRLATDEQLSHVSEIDLYEARNIDRLISIRSESNTKSLSSIDPRKQVIVSASNKELSDLLNQVRWVLTLFPTEAYAQDAEMSLEEFEEFEARALFLDQNDPVSWWRRLSTYQEKLIKMLERGSHVRILGPDTDLSFSTVGRTYVNSDGKQNMPSAEVYTSPVEESINGYLRCSFPVCRYGREIENAKLKFEQGRVVSASATKNEDFLVRMLDIDTGARSVGEFGIGLNSGIQRFTKNILFDEKIGGTVHIAIGKSLPKTGGRNDSSIHWDMIIDLRSDGEIYLDGDLIQKKGRFLDSFLEEAELTSEPK